MACTRVETIEKCGEIAICEEEKRSIANWLKELGTRPLSFLVSMSYRSSRFWTAYLS